jgi:histidine triad (HIT) family protein
MEVQQALVDCIFCAIAAGRIKSDVVYSDDHVVAFRDISPVAPMHVLVIPRRHIGSLMDLGPDDSEMLSAMHQAIQKIADEQGMVAAGFRVVVNVGEGAGQTVGHLHYHVLGGRDLNWPPG